MKRSLPSPIRTGMYIRMPQLVKCKAFKSNKENIKQSNGMELTFILEIKLPKEHCFAMFL